MTGSIRNRMQEIMGYGGRGLVFPFRAANTHAPYDYKTSCEGMWNYNRSTQRDPLYDMGIIGATINTTDSMAKFRIVFRDGFIKDNYTDIKIYCKQDSLSFDLKMKYSEHEAALLIDCNQTDSEHQYIEVTLPKGADTLEFFVHKTEARQKFLEFYGLLIESRDNNGVLYNSTGVNGAGYRSVLRQKLFGKQLSEMKPDLVVIDLGANDFFAGGFNATDIESNLKKIVDMIQTSSPNTAIIINCAQDIYYRRKRDVIECANFAELTRKVAIEKHCGFYNYYEVAGGKGSMNQWYKRGLAQSDKVHLTTPGYTVRGELFLNALLNSYLTYLTHPGEDSLLAVNNLIDTTSLKSYFVDDVNFGIEARKIVTDVYHEPEMITEGENKIYYTIRRGDNLGSIAAKFGVSVKELQYWNGLSGTTIIAGKTLLIYKKGAQPQTYKPPQVQTNKPPSQTKPQATVPRTGARKIAYTVKQGDTLWALAKKYNTTVDAIKKANNLKSDKLSIGQILLIP
jgi:LysM repeat protein/lysophospholipase L1-like esterase